MTDDTVSVNEDLNRFESIVDGHLAFLRYEKDGGRIVLAHTEVPSELEGRGVGSALARAALDYARKNDLAVVPRCPFVKAYLERHPQASEGLTFRT